jgi:proprotein convertase subtilisin/kexin type 5
MVGGAGCLPLLLVSSLANWFAVAAASSFTNEFAVFVPAGGETADRLADRYGFHNRGQIGDLSNYFLFEHRGLTKRSANPSTPHSALLTQDPEVAWFEQQRELRRVKRDFQTVKKRDFALEASAIWDEVFSEFHSGGGGEHSSPLIAKSVETTKQRRNSFPFSDPMFGSQWYINGGGRNGADMNVKRAWELGYSGKGVVVSILDDGIQHNHPDLAQNYDPFASTDINDNDLDPMPQDNGDNKHGTRCAGEVAAVANNNICGVGIAYNASIGGVRMLDGVVNDAVEARALSLNPDHIDIYSASWGPEDDGRTVDGPGPLAKRAFLNGVTRGRSGKGSIFVWASGNGGRHVDDCNCDGYTNSIFTLSISSASQNGFKPWYLEQCSSTLATTFSSGTPGQVSIPHPNC